MAHRKPGTVTDLKSASIFGVLFFHILLSVVAHRKPKIGTV
jgi:hypothetical protein